MTPIKALTSIWTYRLIRWLLSFVFLYAGATKLADPKAFAALIDAYGIVPDPLLMPVAVGLPLLEVVAAIGLMADVRGSLGIISGFMAYSSPFWSTVSGWAWMWTAAASARRTSSSRAYHGLGEALYRDLVMGAGIAYLYVWRRLRSAGLITVANVVQLVMKGELKMGSWVKTGD